MMLKLDKEFPVEQFETTSQSAPSPHLNNVFCFVNGRMQSNRPQNGRLVCLDEAVEQRSQMATDKS